MLYNTNVLETVLSSRVQTFSGTTRQKQSAGYPRAGESAARTRRTSIPSKYSCPCSALLSKHAWGKTRGHGKLNRRRTFYVWLLTEPNRTSSARLSKLTLYAKAPSHHRIDLKSMRESHRKQRSSLAFLLRFFGHNSGIGTTKAQFRRSRLQAAGLQEAVAFAMQSFY